jgi:hypothetical protein
LQNGGALILHLADKHRFNTVVKAGCPTFIHNPQKHSSERITKTEIDFHDFTYLSKYIFDNNQLAATFTETFTDATTKHVRQNERTLYMETENDVLKIASQCGFSQHAKINMESLNDDSHQNIYILV